MHQKNIVNEKDILYHQGAHFWHENNFVIFLNTVLEMWELPPVRLFCPVR